MRNFTLIFLILPLFGFGQSWPDTATAIDKMMSAYPADKPGCQLSISRDGRILYSKAFGMADLEHGVPMTTETPTEAGSVSKQFTAAAVLLLAQEGKLSVNDDIRKYFPELPDLGKTIRISNLLHHTSGLRDWGAVSAITGWPRSTKNYTNEDVLAIIVAQRALNFEPGAEYGYSNSNFNLLAILVKRLSGKSLAEFTRERIFIPAGMTHTQWRDDHNRIVPGRAIAYDRKNGGFVTDMPEEDAYGNGGLLTTTEDLLKWQDFYLSGKLGGKALLDEQLHVEKLNNGVPNGYAAGLMLTFDGDRLININHSGSTAGYRANLEHLVDQHLTIAWLANSSLMDGASHRVAATVKSIFQPTFEDPAPMGDGELLPITKLNEFTGWYRNERTNAGLLITREGNHLLVNGKTKLIFPLEQSDIFIDAEDNGYVFSKDHPRVLGTSHARTPGPRYIEAPTATGKSTISLNYSGTYYSRETGSELSVFQQEGKYILHVKPGMDLVMSPTYVDGFDLPAWNGNAFFIRSASGGPGKLQISVDRARKVEFIRKN